MGSSPPKLPELLATAAPGIAAAMELLELEVSDRFKRSVEDINEREAIAKAHAELKRKAAELAQKERELERERKRLQEEAARTTQPAPSGRYGARLPVRKPT